MTQGWTRVLFASAFLFSLVWASVVLATPPGVSAFGMKCSDCHTSKNWQVLPEKIVFDHGKTGFPLIGNHAPVPCKDCHSAKLVPAHARRACGSCHDDPHKNELGVHCESCHKPTSWATWPMFTRHRQTRFPLMGAHAAVDCTACHGRQRAGEYRMTPTDCYSCHRADYWRPGIHPNHVKAGFRVACDTCHTQYAWSPSHLRHDLYWPLRGAHAVANCSSCHKNGVYGGTPKQCQACHMGEYQAALKPPHDSQFFSTRCNDCHTDFSWRPAKISWHDPFFRISSGDHSGFSCSECHTGNARQPNAFSCIGCHTKGPTASEHDDVAGYVWESFACYSCHPRGDD